MGRIRRKLVILITAGAIAAATAAPALADRSFGPGAGAGQGVEKCHPPGQTKTTPGCK